MESRPLPYRHILPRKGLYVHIPFCETKCGYCDFYSVPLRGRNTAPLVDRVCRELRTRIAQDGEGIRTIFCGGGTPTLLPPDVLSRLLTTLVEIVPMNDVEEFTVEANPATVDEEKARLLVGHGVNRVSMGAQSFFPTELAALERIHSPDDIPPSVATLRTCGIPQVNLDLIFGIPGQTLETWRESLRRTIELEPDHLSCYGLTFEPGTALTARKAQGLVTPCDEQLEVDMFLLAEGVLADAGFQQYEISNFAKPGRESRHNLVYWRNEPYIGVGPSATGCLPQNQCGHGRETGWHGQLAARGTWDDKQPAAPARRYKNIADVARYSRAIDQEGHAEAESEWLDRATMALEMILMQLRLNEGLSKSAFQERTGWNPSGLFNGTLDRLVADDLLEVSATHIALTRQGRLVANAVMGELAAKLPEPGDDK